MSDNTEALLDRLPQGSFAHELVSLLRDQPREQWEEALRDSLRKRVEQEIERFNYGPNRTPGD